MPTPKYNKQIPTLNKSLIFKPQLTEHFIIELETDPIEGIKIPAYFISEYESTVNIHLATKFQSINTALQFNRIIEGRIQSIFN